MWLNGREGRWSHKFTTMYITPDYNIQERGKEGILYTLFNWLVSIHRIDELENTSVKKNDTAITMIVAVGLARKKYNGN